MASTKISAMSAATTPSYTAPIPVVQSGNNYTLTKKQVQANQPNQTAFTGSSLTFDCSVNDVFRVTGADARTWTWGFSNVQNGKTYHIIASIPDITSWTSILLAAGTNANWASTTDGQIAELNSYLFVFVAVGNVVCLQSYTKLASMPTNV
jgi:hypothetical protein